MVHLNELFEKYGSKGVEVIGISKSAKSDVEKFVADFSVKYPTVSERSDSMKAYGRTSYPSAVLIDTGGRVLWVGHPGEFPESKLEEELSSAKILPRWPDALDDVKKVFLKEHYAEAIAKVEKHLEGGKLEGDDKTAAEGVRDWLVWYGTSTLESAQKAVDAGKYYDASVELARVADLYKHHDLASKADAALTDLLSDEARKREVKAGEKLAKILDEIRDMAPKKALKKLQPMLSKKYEDTTAGKKAAEVEKELEQEAAKA